MPTPAPTPAPMPICVSEDKPPESELAAFPVPFGELLVPVPAPPTGPENDPESPEFFLVLLELLELLGGAELLELGLAVASAKDALKLGTYSRFVSGVQTTLDPVSAHSQPVTVYPSATK